MLEKDIKTLLKKRRYQNLFEEDRNKKRKYLPELYRNLSEKEKKKRISMFINDIKIVQSIK